MADQLTRKSVFPAPISQDWTIERLLDWFGEDDARLGDSSLGRPLRALEESLTGSRWTHELSASYSEVCFTREPTTIILVRSVAAHIGAHPALRARTIGEVASDAALCAREDPIDSGAERRQRIVETQVSRRRECAEPVSQAPKRRDIRGTVESR